ncbi:MAG: lipoprotein, partial [Clostridia bacterium]|nr:lipoprotein [Clostridia bacterium]
MKRFLSILTAVAMLASCAVVSFADEAENDIMLISEAPEADLVADSAADIVADSAADIVAD